MQSKGIRILDKIGRAISVELPDILEEVENETTFYWSILDLDAVGHLGKELPFSYFQWQVSNSDRGYFFNWRDLNLLACKFDDITDIELIAFKEKNSLRRFENDQEMYEQCDISIVMFDSSYWEVFSKDEDLIKRLAKKFREIEFIDPDFER